MRSVAVMAPFDLTFDQHPRAVDLRIDGAGRRNRELCVTDHEVAVDAAVHEQVLGAFEFAGDDEGVADTGHVGSREWNREYIKPAPAAGRPRARRPAAARRPDGY